MADTKTKALLALSLRDMAQHEADSWNRVLDEERRRWSAEQGYKVPLRRESFEAILRAVPPEPGRGSEDNTATHPARQDHR